MSTLRLFILVALIGFGLGTGLAWLTRDSDPLPQSAETGAAVGDARPGFRHVDLRGEWVAAGDFDGTATLVNFWATWCAPCRREMPLLQAISEDRGGQLAVVGIALDDPGPVAAFVDEIGIDYPILVGRSDVMETQRAWGNAAGVLPYTVLVDSDGVIRWQHYGEVAEEELEEALAEVLP